MSVASLEPREERYLVPGPVLGLKLFLRFLPARHRAGESSSGIVVYVHGATFPSALSIAHRFDGKSWRDELNAAGFDVWGLDFQGFGSSDRFPQMDHPPDAHSPLGNAADAAEQLRCAVRFILDRSASSRVSLIAHSWGSMPACRLAGMHPTLVDRLVLFAPIAQRARVVDAANPAFPAWHLVTIEDQHTRFVEDVPVGQKPVLERRHFDEWAERYLDSDPASRERTPAAVKVPGGPRHDVLLAWSGRLPYDASSVTVPVALIRGEWDSSVRDEDARSLFDAFRSTIKRDIKIGGATHLMHLEVQRHALYQESINFLLEGVRDPGAWG